MKRIEHEHVHEHAGLGRCEAVTTPRKPPGSRLSTLALSLSLASACANDLTPSYEVVRPRALAFRTEVQGDPERATPELGESALLRVQVGYPEVPLPATMAGVVCLSTRLPDGTRYCVGEVGGLLEGVSESPDELQLAYDVPSMQDIENAIGDNEALVETIQELLVQGGAPSFVLYGAICTEGSVRRRRDTDDLNAVPLSDVFRCQRPGDADVDFPDPFVFTKALYYPGLDNHNPDIACHTDEEPDACRGKEREGEPRVEGDIVFVTPDPDDDDAPPEVVVWDPATGDPPDRATGCRDDDSLAAFQARVGGDARFLRLRFDPADREPLPDDPDRPEDAADIEELVVYAAFTQGGGSLEGSAKLVDQDQPDDAMEVEFEYEPPEDDEDLDVSIPEDGRRIRFYFLVRDQRGGADFAVRALCLLPEE